MSGDSERVEKLLRKVASDVERMSAFLGQPKKRRIDLENPRWDQNTYWGRVQHFFTVTNPLNLLRTNAELERAKNIVMKYRGGDDLLDMTDNEIWEAKHIYDSAFHPETGEKQIIVGRMSAQVPMNVLITSFMMVFYNQILTAYVAATTGGITASLGLNRVFKHAHPLIGRWVPFFAVAAANAVNIPIMRFREIDQGIPVTTDDGKDVGLSKIAARWGVTQVVISRIAMAIPTMIGIPVVVNKMEKKGILRKYPWVNLPTNAILCGLLLTFATPLGCSIFQQKARMKVSDLEPEIQEKVRKMPNPPNELTYNKGL